MSNLDHIAPDLRGLARPLTDLIHDPRNARRHDERNLLATRESLERFGQQKNIVARDLGAPPYVVVAGNGTLACAAALGWTHLAVSVSVMDDKTAKAYAVADNRTAELAEWDAKVLAEIMAELEEDDPELAASLQITEAELDALLEEQAPPPARGEDPGPSAPPLEPKSRRGEVYQLGPHRLMCGDSTDAADVSTLLLAEEPEVMATDPPYGVELDMTWRDEAGISPVASNPNRVMNDDRADWTPTWKLSRARVAYVWHASAFASVVEASLKAADFEIRQQIIWRKTLVPISRAHYHWAHEPCWYAVRRGKTATWKADRKETTVWDAAPPNHPLAVRTGRGGQVEDGDAGTDHPTQKPVDLWERPIRNHTNTGDLIYDPFGGSGVAIIAAARLGRRAYCMELDPAYCDVIRARWGAWARTAGVDAGTGAL